MPSLLRRLATAAESAAKPVPNRTTVTGSGMGTTFGVAVGLIVGPTVGPAVGVKAAGGIRTLDDARRMIRAGASRLGMSASVAVVEGLSEDGPRDK